MRSYVLALGGLEGFIRTNFITHNSRFFSTHHRLCCFLTMSADLNDDADLCRMLEVHESARFKGSPMLNCAAIY